ncbi:helix-turn-helix transcriptional regulator [Dermabacter hominis]
MPSTAPYLSSDLVTLERAAERLGVTPRTIRRQIASGNITGYRIGNRAVRVSLADVDALARPIPTVATAGGAAR